MSERQERLQNRLQPEIREFRDSCRTLQLATVDGEGNPNASYAPFVLQEDGYYVLISRNRSPRPQPATGAPGIPDADRG